MAPTVVVFPVPARASIAVIQLVELSMSAAASICSALSRVRVAQLRTTGSMAIARAWPWPSRIMARFCCSSASISGGREAALGDVVVDALSGNQPLLILLYGHLPAYPIQI